MSHSSRDLGDAAGTRQTLPVTGNILFYAWRPSLFKKGSEKFCREHKIFRRGGRRSRIWGGRRLWTLRIDAQRRILRSGRFDPFATG